MAIVQRNPGIVQDVGGGGVGNIGIILGCIGILEKNMETAI